MAAPAPSARTTVRRLPARAAYERATIDAIRLRKRELRQALRPRGPRTGRIGGPPAVSA